MENNYFYIFFLFSGLIFGLCATVEVCGKATLNNNGYEDFVIAISPDIPQDYFFINIVKLRSGHLLVLLYFGKFVCSGLFHATS